MTLDDVLREVGRLYLETVGLKGDLAELQRQIEALSPKPESAEDAPPVVEGEGE